MAASIQPLTLDYSFVQNRRTSVDRVDNVVLQSVLQSIVDKVNEGIEALDETMRDDNTLDDGVIMPNHLNEEVTKELSAMIRAELTGS